VEISRLPPVKKIDQQRKLADKKVDVDVSFSSTFFVLSRFRVFLSDGSSKTPQKTFYKETVSKSFDKKSTKNPKPIFSVLFRFFLGEGVQKHDKKHRKSENRFYTYTGPFLASGPPTRHGVAGVLTDRSAGPVPSAKQVCPWIPSWEGS
jgi:hypothetical protein